MKSSRRENLPSNDSSLDLSLAVSCCSSASRARSDSFSSSNSVTLGAKVAIELVVDEVQDVIEDDLSRPERIKGVAVVLPLPLDDRMGGGIELGEIPLALICASNCATRASKYCVCSFLRSLDACAASMKIQ
jgi:hypothetical protein